MKRIVSILSLAATLVLASNFSEAIKLFKSGKYSEAKGYFEQAYHEDGVGAAGYFLGVYYAEGIGGVAKDYTKAKNYLHKAIEAGNIRARCALAKIYRIEGDEAGSTELLSQIDPRICDDLTHRRHVTAAQIKNDAKKD